MENEIKAVFIDVETTGLDHKKNGLLQLSGMVGKIVGKYFVQEESFDFRIRPLKNDLIEDKALEVNKVTKEELLQYPPAELVYGQFTNLLSNYCDKYDKNDKMFFVGYNARFDYDFCRSWFEKLNDKYFGSYFFFPPIDVMNLAIFDLIKERNLLPNFKLGTVCNHYGLNTNSETLHNADVDIRLTIDLFIKLLNK